MLALEEERLQMKMRYKLMDDARELRKETKKEEMREKKKDNKGTIGFNLLGTSGMMNDQAKIMLEQLASVILFALLLVAFIQSAKTIYYLLLVCI